MKIESIEREIIADRNGHRALGGARSGDSQSRLDDRFERAEDDGPFIGRSGLRLSSGMNATRIISGNLKRPRRSGAGSRPSRSSI
jgi:hypothetical protein